MNVNYFSDDKSVINKEKNLMKKNKSKLSSE